MMATSVHVLRRPFRHRGSLSSSRCVDATWSRIRWNRTCSARTRQKHGYAGGWTGWDGWAAWPGRGRGESAGDSLAPWRRSHCGLWNRKTPGFRVRAAHQVKPDRVAATFAPTRARRRDRPSRAARPQAAVWLTSLHPLPAGLSGQPNHQTEPLRSQAVATRRTLPSHSRKPIAKRAIQSPLGWSTDISEQVDLAFRYGPLKVTWPAGAD